MSVLSGVVASFGVAVFTTALFVAAPSAARESAPVPDMLDASLAIASQPAQRPSAIALGRAVKRLPAVPMKPTPAPVARPLPRAAMPAPAAVLGAATGPGVTVIASWYGPGFYGNRTACGQTYTPQIQGVAHKTLPCGTLLRLEFRGNVVAVPVIDRGPYIAGRTLDLSNATRLALACTDLCPVRMQQLR